MENKINIDQDDCMNIKVPIAILACRGVRFIARILHKGGTAKPGDRLYMDCMGKNPESDVKKYLILRPNSKLYSQWDTAASLVF